MFKKVVFHQFFLRVSAKTRNFARMIEIHRHIEILLLSNDCVIVPGLGGFVAHHVEAYYNASEGLFLPPLRTLGFNPQLTINDSLLVHSYIEAYDISYPEALRRIESEVAELRQHIETEGYYELNDLGVMRLGEEGGLLFEPCEAGILSPLLYGLGSFSMQPLEKPEEKPKTADENADSCPADHAIVIKMSWLRNIAAVAAAIIAFVMMTGTPVSNSVSTDSQQNAAFIPIPVVTESAEKAETPVSSESLQTPEATEAREDSEDTEPMQPIYSLVMASQVSRSNATAFVNLLDDAGFDEARVDINHKGLVRVVYGSYASEGEAITELRQLRRQSRHFSQAWVMKME